MWLWVGFCVGLDVGFCVGFWVGSGMRLGMRPLARMRRPMRGAVRPWMGLCVVRLRVWSRVWLGPRRRLQEATA